MPNLRIAGLALAAAAVFIVVGAASGLIVDAAWFRQLGYFVVFRTILGAKVVTFLAAASIAFAVMATVGLRVARHGRERGIVRVVLRKGNGHDTLPELIAPFADRIPWRVLVLGAAGVVAFLFGLAQAASWEKYLLWIYGGSFEEADPYFQRNVGFYVFSLPAYRAMVDGGLAIVVLSGLVGGTLFWLQGALDLRRPGDSIPPEAVRLASLLLAVFLLLKAFGYWLGRFELLLEPYGAVFGAGYTVSHIKVPLQWLMMLAAIVGAGLAAANVRSGGWQLAVGAIVVWFGVSLLSVMLPDLYQRLRVRPDELRLEHAYLQHNIDSTRRAFGLDKIQSRPFPAETPLDAGAVDRNWATFANVRLWDPGPLLDAYKQLQVIRLYYDFHDVDVDRYDVKGVRRQVMLAPREIVPSLLPQNARTWVNQRLQFTHGFGAVMSPVTELEGEGLPVMFLKDIPPVSPVGLEVKEPRIYFGERTDDYVIVGGAAEEFDYPSGEANVTNHYAGKDGVRLGSLLRRLIFSWRFGDLNLLISGNLRSDSRILFRRSIDERVSAVAPFLRLDRDPYLVISEGRMFWIQDAYTIAATYPYSEPVPGTRFNYIRNSVKVVVDAYNGTVDLYAVDEKEPVLAAYSKIFPGLFKPIAEMPEDLRRHVRYPEGLFRVQAEMYRTYHMTSPDVFYNKEDLWSFPSETVGNTKTPVQPYYTIMKLPGEKKEEFILMLPMTPSNRNNMVAWLAARNDGEAYGEVVEFAFPKDRLIYGPQQIEARIDQDTLISQQLSLWNQMGSKVIRGNLLVIPVEDAVVYIEPLYLRSEQGQIPELKRVIVAYGDRVVMERSLDAALERVFSGAPAPPSKPIHEAADAVAPAAPAPAPAAPSPPKADRTARQHYESALEKLRTGDWQGFGREMEALGRSLEATPP